MNFEDMQNAWQSHDSGAKVTINADVLLKEIRRNQQQVRKTIFWRDAREIGAVVFLTLIWLHDGIQLHDWSLFLFAFVWFGVFAFQFVDRLLHRKKQPVSTDSIKACIETSLFLVNHQIWCRTKVYWGSFLLLTVALGILINHSAWPVWNSDSSAESDWLISAILIGLVVGGLYWLTWVAVRKDLEPRRQELETLLANLK